jgi:hypothetical protein
MGGFRETKDGATTAVAADAHDGGRGDVRPRHVEGMRPLGEWFRESVPVRGAEKRHEEDTEKHAKEQDSDAGEEKVFHVRDLHREWPLRRRATCGRGA